MSELIDQITAVLRDYYPVTEPNRDWWAAHVAERVAAELPEELTVWFCNFCRETVQIGAKPDICGQCHDGESLDPYSYRWVR